ncbi:1-pyrroline-5-carboxylate dehydrogenase [Thozetella sp. PMI_491]|nr:1-pyrroline-5-carboxylate dehydrogenase [Thozetella sp. PMI_491]
MAPNATFRAPEISNESLRHYYAGSAERAALQAAIDEVKRSAPYDIPLVISGKHIRSPRQDTQLNPSSHRSILANYSIASSTDTQNAIDGALAAKPAWLEMSLADRSAIFLKAADLIASKHRYRLMAATMLGQGKNAWQAEIDAAAEAIDFLRFGVRYAQELHAIQPPFNSEGCWNKLEYRPLEGFVYAVSPFNFTAIAANLVVTPALMGNVVIWKPSPSAMLSNYIVYETLLEAGLPSGVIQFLPGDAVEITKAVLNDTQFGGLHFTGSTAVFRSLVGQIGQGIAEQKYKGFPRYVGETGGKNAHIIHQSADVQSAVCQTIRAAFEYQGQKCSACSRLYVPKSLWPVFKAKLIRETEKLQVGNVEDWETFVGPVIHRASFKKLSGIIDAAKNDDKVELLAGGKYDDSEGWFIHPTVYLTTNPRHQYMKEELFGPILMVFVYEDESSAGFADVCKLADATTPYALTTAVFARDVAAIRTAENILKYSAGNFYINSKCTGAVVGQQPFGGGKASGTNDKAGSGFLLSRFVSPRSIKEEFLPLEEVLYPSNYP